MQEQTEFIMVREFIMFGPMELLMLVACFGFLCLLAAVPIVVVLVARAKHRQENPAVCPQCRQSAPPGAANCPHCGRPLSPQ
jgi:ribosomal protein L40E